MKFSDLKSYFRENAVIILIGGSIIFAFLIIILFAVSEGSQAQKSSPKYSITDEERPRAEFGKSSENLGNLKVQDERQAEFMIKNIGNRPLVISRISSSCDCTYGQVEIDGKVSPEFGMHSKSNWSETIEPEKSGKLTVIYRPYVMPVKGPVERYVYVETNDPVNSKITFTVSANVD